MKAILSAFFLSIITMNAFSQTWAQKASVPSTIGLVGPFSFSINGKLYVGGGYGNGSAHSEFFEYDPTSDTWTTKTSIPGAEYTAASFVINGKGYVACGANPSITRTVYMYDPVTNTWTRKSNFPGVARQSCVGFSLNGKGYVFAGFIGGASNSNDMWEYDPTNDSWLQKASAPGPGRNNPIYLKISNKVYVGLGSTTNAVTLYSDFYEFDPVGNTYTAKANFPVASACDANFTIGTDGYVGTGWNAPNAPITTFYKYNAVANSWTQVNNFGGPGRGHSFCEEVGNKPYVGCGDATSGYLHDNWTWVDSCTGGYSLGPDTTLCSGGSIILRDTIAGASTLWNTGSTAASISVNTTGSYWVQVTKGACTFRDTIRVTFANPPSAFSIGNDTTYCGGFSRILSTGIATTRWSTGTIASSITVSGAGIYWAEIRNACGTFRDSMSITQNALPAFSLGNDTALCAGNTIMLNATAPGANYQWQDGTTNPVFTVSSAGVYWVDVSANGCTKRDSVTVNYLNPVTFNIGNDTTYCGAFSRRLFAGIGDAIWSTGDTAASIVVTTPGLYSAFVIACGDTLKDSLIIYQNPLPIVSLGRDTSLCNGTLLTLDGTTASASYSWQDSSSSPLYQVSGAGTYWVDVSVNGCTSRDSIYVRYVSPPSIQNLVGDTTICEDSVMVLNVYEPYARYTWSTGDTTSSISISGPNQYSVTVSNQCGSTTASTNIDVKPCVCRIAVPTAFSPNDDGRNDVFAVLYQCPVSDFTLSIYNRWGELIFASNDITAKWDGKYKNTPQPAEVFIWYCQYTDPYTNERKSLTGNLTLLR